ESSQPQGQILATTQEARASDVMPWEQFDGTSPTQETSPPTSSNLVTESLDVPGVVIEPAPAGLVPQDLEVPPSASTGLIEEANRFGKELLPSIVAESSLPSNGQHDDMEEAIVERSPLVEEGGTSSSS